MDDWTFRSANTKQVTHGIHAYPAMMIPQIAQRLIHTYGREGGLLFDPYCGSGTTLLEGLLANSKAAGTDLNPLARLIARVKTRPVNISALDREIARFPTKAPRDIASFPAVPNADYWFAPEAQHDLAAIRQHIDNISDANIADVFRVAFSQTVRKASWTRQSEFKLYRMPQCEMEKHDPKPFGFMQEKLTDIRQALQLLKSMIPVKGLYPAIHSFNTVSGIPAEAIAPGSIDLVVTSPPYGDSRTTVAYGQFCRLSSQWLGYAEANRVDNILMGGDKIDSLPKFGVEKLDKAIAEIARIHESRAREVASFFRDYQASISNVANAMARGGYACYVVGNRTVKGHRVPTAEATASFFEKNGFKTVKIHCREIPNKRMPSVNSPSNIHGEVGRTMTKEQIVICRKVG